MEFKLLSNAFKNGEYIPDRYSYTHPGKNMSPPLNWENPPEQTKSFAVILEDVDVPLFGTFCHWLLYNIPSEQNELKEGLPRQESFSDGTMQGKNFFNQNAYMEPSPPFGTHRYYFKIYALDTKLKPDPKMTRKKLLKAMDGHILGESQLMGLYAKK